MTTHFDTAITLAADIVSAFISNNSVPSNEIAAHVGDVHAALTRLSARTDPAPAPEVQKAGRPRRENR